MTPTLLLDGLKTYIEEKTKNLRLPVRRTKDEKEGERAPKVFLMNLPKKEDEIQQIPYILIKYLTGNDEQTQGNYPESEVAVRIIVATYGENAEEGSMSLLSIISSLRLGFLKDQEINNQFRLVLPIQNIVYPDDTRPYYLGEIMTTWTLPPIRRELKLNDHNR